MTNEALDQEMFLHLRDLQGLFNSLFMDLPPK